MKTVWKLFFCAAVIAGILVLAVAPVRAEQAQVTATATATRLGLKLATTDTPPADILPNAPVETPGCRGSVGLIVLTLLVGLRGLLPGTRPRGV